MFAAAPNTLFTVDGGLWGGKFGSSTLLCNALEASALRISTGLLVVHELWMTVQLFIKRREPSSGDTQKTAVPASVGEFRHQSPNTGSRWYR